MTKVIELSFKENNLSNIFKKKSNKTLQETILTNRYKHLKQEVDKNYKSFLNLSIGDFLYELKSSNNTFYKEFLNLYGDLVSSSFCIKNRDDYNLKGIYFYCI